MLTKCGFCSKTLDIFGNHAASCTGKKGISWRHNRVRDCIGELSIKAGFKVEIEKPYLLPLNDTLRPGDIYIEQWKPDRGICLDVSIVNPIASSNIRNASRLSAHAAKEMEKTKNDKYLNLCNSADLEFSPLVMETFGGFGPAAIPILKRIGKALSNRTDQDESISMNNLCNQISFVCQKSLGETLRSRYPTYLTD